MHEIILESEADAGTQEDRQSDGAVGEGLSCYVFNSSFVILYTMTKTCINEQVIPC